MAALIQWAAFGAICTFATASAARDLWRAAKAWRGIKRQLERMQRQEFRFTVRQYGKGD